MQQNYIDTYTKLKLKTNSEVIVTFYSSYGYKEVKKYKLKDVNGFSSVLVENDEEQVNIPFFGLDAMIESITIIGDEHPLYFNPHLNENVFDGFCVRDGLQEQIKKQVFGDIDIDILLKDRAKFIQRYNMKTVPFEYDDLFFSDKQKQEFNSFFNQLIGELVEYAKSQDLDSTVSLINKGTTSLIYSVGDKIIKIGKPRRKPNIPYCEYLLQPIINRNFEFDGYPIHVEVTEKVVVCKNANGNFKINDEEFEPIAIDLKQKLTAIGLKSSDLHSANVGILLKDNGIHFDAINFEVGNENATSIQNNNNLRMRKKGETILIDLDDIEIEDISKYSDYLRNIGFDETTIQNSVVLNSKPHKKV